MGTDNFLTGQDVALARKRFEEEGCFLIENAYDGAQCEQIKGFIDGYSSDDVEINYKGTEIRIWDAQRKDPMLAEFYQKCHQTVSTLFSEPLREKTLLAIRNKPVSQTDRDVQMGRWHLDSFFRQIKIFLFLTDTTEKSGPFEFLPRSQAEPFKYKNLVMGRYFKPTDLLKKNRKYQSLDEAWIEKLSTHGYRPKPVLCKAGTAMIVNTSAIHRARPCLEGSRYALTTYYY